MKKIQVGYKYNNLLQRSLNVRETLKSSHLIITTKIQNFFTKIDSINITNYRKYYLMNELKK